MTATAIAVKERPILFSGAMVRAILEGRKTQTRRVIQPQPIVSDDDARVLPEAWATGFIGVHCPFGKPGEHLWVRETWRATDSDQICGARIFYEADQSYRWIEGYWCDFNPDRKRPSIFMPRWASRITLEITGVRVERLQEISEADAKAEGVRGFVEDGCWVYENYELGRGTWEFTARGSFITLWDSINGKREGCSWADNPWVWIIEFRRLV